MVETFCFMNSREGMGKGGGWVASQGCYLMPGFAKSIAEFWCLQRSLVSLLSAIAATATIVAIIAIMWKPGIS